MTTISEGRPDRFIVKLVLSEDEVPELRALCTVGVARRVADLPDRVQGVLAKLAITSRVLLTGDHLVFCDLLDEGRGYRTASGAVVPDDSCPRQWTFMAQTDLPPKLAAVPAAEAGPTISALAAERIHALINSRPYTPAVQEMQAIIMQATAEVLERRTGEIAAMEGELAEALASLLRPAEREWFSPIGDDAIATAERQACWDAINSHIKEGPLPEPAHSERNGLVKAANIIMARGGVCASAPVPGDWIEVVRQVSRLDPAKLLK